MSRFFCHIALIFSFLPLFVAGQGEYAEKKYESEFEAEALEAIVAGRDVDAMRLFMSIDPDMDENQFMAWSAEMRGQWLSLEEEMERKRTEHQKIDLLFRWLRSNWLYEYAPVASLPELLRQRRFNCVSSTALMCLALNEFGYKHYIMEAPRHIYLYVEAGSHLVRVETTSEDIGPIRVGKRKAARIRNLVAAEESTAHNYLNSERPISFRELAGLQYYNDGLLRMDQRDYQGALSQFSKALALYPCTRIREMQLDAVDHCSNPMSLTHNPVGK